MAVASSYDLPQYVGELFERARRPNALLRLIGGITGALRLVQGTTFPMGVDYTLDAGSQPDILEGADPTPSQTATTQGSNVVQIFQEAVSLTYSRQGASAIIDGVAIIPGAPAGNVPLVVPGTIEWQIQRKIEQISLDANYSFLRGTYQSPSDNNTSRKTRGILTAVSTNDFNNTGTARALTKTIFENALRDSMDNGMFEMGDTIFCLGDATQIAALINLYESDTQLPISRVVAGVGIREIVTKWATVNLSWEPDMPTGELCLFRPEFCRVVVMPVPNGLIFVEPLAKTGAADTAQAYTEMGIDYRHEVFVASIDDLATS